MGVWSVVAALGQSFAVVHVGHLFTHTSGSVHRYAPPRGLGAATLGGLASRGAMLAATRSGAGRVAPTHVIKVTMLTHTHTCTPRTHLTPVLVWHGH